MVVASLAEVAQDMGAPIAAYVDVIFLILYLMLSKIRFFWLELY